MTREEAIEQLNFIKQNMPKEPPTGCDYIKEWLDTDKDIRNALDMAIKSLEAWDKVIEEIESQQKFNIECDGESDLGMAIQIIKKHLGEVEE